MNPYGILTSYEERMKANLQRYQRLKRFLEQVVQIQKLVLGGRCIGIQATLKKACNILPKRIRLQNAGFFAKT